MNFVNVNFQTTLWFRFKLTLVTLKLLQRAAARSFFDILFFFFLFAEVDVEEEGAVGLIDCSTALQSIKCKLKCTWFSFVWENPKILTFLCKPTKISETQLADKLTMRDFKKSNNSKVSRVSVTAAILPEKAENGVFGSKSCFPSQNWILWRQFGHFCKLKPFQSRTEEKSSGSQS